MNLAATDLLIDSAKQTDRSRTLFCRDIVTDLHHFSWKMADGLYLSKVDSDRIASLIPVRGIAPALMSLRITATK
ncbi:hypothetical protein [Mucilaginibacter flavus]|uniref:hypothetical protein n=1 Tax=Mucilaginibacter flavus TaxID=931504 RepID=UPI0025B2A4C4|nr:hypothetical protein [Mucilaginibacter flavus]MDN3583468.1 hypothetical protein [Mucilaginibacter flavus]